MGIIPTVSVFNLYYDACQAALACWMLAV